MCPIFNGCGDTAFKLVGLTAIFSLCGDEHFGEKVIWPLR